MYKALVIGCGNIGALYDMHSPEIFTHTKAFFKNPDFTLAVYDTDRAKAKKIAKKYKAVSLPSVSEGSLAEFDVVSICTPTHLHFEILKTLLLLNTKVIICEKPISYSLHELKELKRLYKKSRSLVLINYPRRFQPAYIKLKEEIAFDRTKTLTTIVIKYKRGLLNNASHAFDTLEFLLNKKFNLKDISITNKTRDAFTNDPSCTLSGRWGATYVIATGITKLNYPLFEMELYFDDKKIIISDSGQKIETYTYNKSFVTNLKKQENCLHNYMKYVINEVQPLLTNAKSKDNFMSSLKLNETLLNYLQK